MFFVCGIKLFLKHIKTKLGKTAEVILKLKLMQCESCFQHMNSVEVSIIRGLCSHPLLAWRSETGENFGGKAKTINNKTGAFLKSPSSFNDAWELWEIWTFWEQEQVNIG